MRNFMIESAPRDFHVIEGGRSQEQTAREKKIEARLHTLGDAVEEFISSLSAGLLVEHSSSREIIEELIVKHCALQWIARVAKHSHGAVRQKLWSDIDQSLAGLEKALELLPRLRADERHSRIQQESLYCAVSSN